MERRRQVNRYHTLSNKSNSSKRKNLRYNIDKYKLSKSDRKIKRRLQQQETPTPSEKVSNLFEIHNFLYILKIGEHLAQRYFHGDPQTVKRANRLKHCPPSKILCLSFMFGPIRDLSILQPSNEGSTWNKNHPQGVHTGIPKCTERIEISDHPSIIIKKTYKAEFHGNNVQLIWCLHASTKLLNSCYSYFLPNTTKIMHTKN